MKAAVTILEQNMEVEYDFHITAHGSSGAGPSFGGPGEPPEPAEFDIEILGLSFPKQAADVELEVPQWLKDMLQTYLYEREDINEIVQMADRNDGGSDHDYDYDF